MKRHIAVEEVKNKRIQDVMLKADCSYDAARRRLKKYDAGLITEEALYSKNTRLIAQKKREDDEKRQAEYWKDKNVVENPTELIRQVMQSIHCDYSSARVRVRKYEQKILTWNDLFRPKGAPTEADVLKVQQRRTEQLEATTVTDQHYKERIHLFENRRILDRSSSINGKVVNVSKLIRDIQHKIGLSYETARTRVRNYEKGLLKEEDLFSPKDFHKGHKYSTHTLNKLEQEKTSAKIKEALNQTQTLQNKAFSVLKIEQKHQNDINQQDKLKKVIDSLNLNDNAKIWISHCPVTCGKATKMTKETFRKVCELKHNERITTKSLVKYTRCEYCKKNEEYWPPELEIIDIQQYLSKNV